MNADSLSSVATATFVLDECDHHVNKMAVDSLRYHLSPQCLVDNEHTRERYEALLAQFQEPSPFPTPEEQAGIVHLKAAL